MFTTKIGLTGHRPSGFSNAGYALKICKATIAYYAHTLHSKNHPIEFNAGGCIGADMWAIEKARQIGIPYNLYLPFPGYLQTSRWSPEDARMYNAHVLQAKSIWTARQNYAASAYFVRDQKIVDNSHFVVAFWEGRRSGGTYNTIKYALNKGKQVFNALDDLTEIVPTNIL